MMTLPAVVGHRGLGTDDVTALCAGLDRVKHRRDAKCPGGVALTLGGGYVTPFHFTPCLLGGVTACGPPPLRWHVVVPPHHQQQVSASADYSLAPCDTGGATQRTEPAEVADAVGAPLIVATRPVCL